MTFKNVFLKTCIYSLILFFIGCTHTGEYDPLAFKEATSLKVDSLYLMDLANSSFSSNRDKVRALRLNIDKAHEYSKARTNNEIITEQWEIMKDPAKNLIGGFIKRWQEKSVLSSIFINESKINISHAFDQIIGLESGLIKPNS